MLGTVKTVVVYLGHHARQMTPTARRARVRDIEFDRQFGVDTSGIVELSRLDFNSPSYESGIRYQASSPSLLREALKTLKITYEDFIFIDIGSGKGRALLLASEFPFKRVVGVEFAPQLHAIAVKNIQSYETRPERCARMESLCLDAAAYDIPHEPIVVYFYHPFEEDVMSKVLANIKRSLDSHQRRTYVIYQNPQFAALFERVGVFEPTRVTEDYIVYRTKGGE
jgi:SAM-dependent methyltransferase